MAPKKKLQVENNYDFFLFGISCPEKPYRLCWALNNQLKTAFAKDKDMEANVGGTDKKDKRPMQSKFPVFAFYNEEMFTDYRVIINKSGNKVLVPEYRQADYLLMVQGSTPVEKNFILKKVKEVTFVQTAFEIDPKKIRSKENFIF